MTKVLRLVERLSRWMTIAGGILIVIAAAVICVEITARHVFNKTFVGVDEISGYALAIGTTWSLGFALLHKAHVRIDALYAHMPPALKPWLDIASLAVLGAVVGVLTFRAGELAYLSLAFGSRSMTPLATPLVIPQGLWALGLVAFLLLIVLLLARSVRALASGDHETVTRLAGPASVQEEIEEELGDVVRRASTGGRSQ